MEPGIEVKLVLKLTFDEYFSIIFALEKEVDQLSAIGATCLCDEARRLLSKIRESYFNGLFNENREN